jgi:hypothetical protein
MSRSIKIWKGYARDIPIQCVLIPTGSTPAVFGPADTLTAAMYQSGVDAAVFEPTVGWYTKDNQDGPTQTGYDQGEVLVSVTNEEAALLQPSVPYNLIVVWSPASNPTQSAPVASIPITVRNRNAQ